MNLSLTELKGQYVRLVPISKANKAEIGDAIRDGELWKLHVTRVPHPDKVDAFIAAAQASFEAGDGLTFVTIDKATDRIAGSSRFMKANFQNKRIEIGHTFLGARWQRTRINTEAKLLMLTHAFEVLDLNRVEFLTDYLNTSSRAAILRLGAKEEGILRNHMVMSDGRIRDSVVHSVIRSEWPGVKQHLSQKLV